MFLAIGQLTKQMGINLALCALALAFVLAAAPLKAEIYFEYEWRRATVIVIGGTESTAAEDCRNRELTTSTLTRTTNYVVTNVNKDRSIASKCEITNQGQTTTTYSTVPYDEFCRKIDTDLGTSQLVAHSVCVEEIAQVCVPPKGKTQKNQDVDATISKSGEDGTVGDPIDLTTNRVVDNHYDWTSPLDARFSFMRFYSSGLDVSYSMATNQFGGNWHTEWDIELENINNDTNKFGYHASNGAIFRYSGTGAAADRGYVTDQLVVSDPQFGGKRVIRSGNGMIRVFEAGVTGVSSRSQLVEKIWPDGYKITLTYDANDRLEEIADTRGQVAKYTWDNTATDVNGVTQTVGKYSVSKIEIDTNYDGSTFATEVELVFAYDQLNAKAAHVVGLGSVSLVDVPNSNTIDQWGYTYDVDRYSYPLLLTEVADGRTDGLGAQFANVTFEYDADALPIVTKGFGDAAKTTLTRNVDGTTSVFNSLGKESKYTFEEVDGRKRVSDLDGVATTHCLGSSKQFDYTPSTGAPEGYIYSKTNRNGAVTNYTRDADGLVLTKTEDANGSSPRVTTYTWHASLRVPLTRSTSQLKETFTYDADGLLLTYIQEDVLVGSPDLGDTRTWTYGYTTLASGLKVLTSVDGPGLVADGVTDVTTYEYDANGVLTKTTDANGLVTEILTTNAFGQPTKILSPENIDYNYTYDYAGRLLTVHRKWYSVASYTYDEIGHLLTSTDSNGDTTTYVYDEAKRLTSITTAAGDVATYTYDLMGNLTKTEYSDGTSAATFVADTEYDKLGRLLKTIGGEGQAWNFEHDVEDNLDKVTDPTTLASTKSFDALNRLTSTVDRASGTTAMDHNDSDLQTQYKDPRGLDTDFVYNGFGDLLSETSPDRGTMTYTYNSRGLVEQMTDARGIVSNYTYDNGGRLKTRRFPSDPSNDQVFAYDWVSNNNKAGRGKIYRMLSEATFYEMKYNKNSAYPSVYDQKLNGVQYRSNMSFNNNSQMISLQYPSKTAVQFTFDDDQRITKIETRKNIKVGGSYPAWDVVVNNVTYAPMGPVTNMTYGDSFVQTSAFDKSYRQTSVQDALSATILRSITYGFDARDDLISVADQVNAAMDETYSYTNRQLLDIAAGNYGSLDFDYDANGNRVSKATTVASVTTTDTYTYPLTDNKLSQIATSGGGHTRLLSYDAAGNVTSEVRADGTYSYTYNAANRMASMSIDGVLQAEYEYNAAGQQAIRRLPQQAKIIHSVYDLDGNRIAEYDFDDATNTSTLIREYVWFQGVPVAVIEGGNLYYVRTDHIGKPVFATDGTGAKVWEVSYLPFGSVETVTGSPMELRFPGQWFQTESGLHQNWMRDYNPTTGRYLQGDPLGLIDGASVYGYALQSPGRYVDPRGEFVAGTRVIYVSDEAERHCSAIVGSDSSPLVWNIGTRGGGPRFGSGGVLGSQGKPMGTSSKHDRWKANITKPNSFFDKAASKLGYKKTKQYPFNSHGQTVYTRNGKYITGDADGHKGGVWKMYNRKGQRIGTMDGKLNRIGE